MGNMKIWFVGFVLHISLFWLDFPLCTNPHILNNVHNLLIPRICDPHHLSALCYITHIILNMFSLTFLFMPRSGTPSSNSVLAISAPPIASFIFLKCSSSRSFDDCRFLSGSCFSLL